ncbi:VCBS repeat-containing protein [Rhodocytophaga aerolata]|uniref:VCBS repeat-containing protein n=3 Tax=Rhodocytophaga aerolata TaxID=455078 RepID=A0ABT8RGK6_9BACT|nr:VCBS repeat-containing protein [Rhodocytophaga aerolata]MDO1450283.1 VCBS repeat-containing protein [Rhodocytophaga aerolata]
MQKINNIITWICIGLFAAACDTNSSQVFKRLPASQTGIHFNNTIQEDDTHHVFSYTNIYTGAGVAAGDINNDGLTDLYFSGNMVTGRLYLNKGNLQFEDITESAGIVSTRWGTGATMVDINQDGWTDMYVCVSGSATGDQRANLLYINNGDNTFTDRAKEYGLADTRQVMHASFFDYDLDGDLDVCMIINPASIKNNVNTVQPRKLAGESPSTDALYRNNGNNTFTDVSKEAGILAEGYSLGLAISDINKDGWPDIYISNDFISNEVLYINNQNGTFTNQAASYLKHTSYAGMGNDIADINNDGLVDIVVADMRPEDNFRQKLIIPSSRYDRFKLALDYTYEPQYSRNTLQLNQGNGKFSEIGFLAGVSSTDWSWSTLLADYDNDGDRDLFVTNGFLRDLGDLDYIHYQNIYNGPMGTVEAKMKNKLEAIKSLNIVPLQDYLYENVNGLTFSKRSSAWGIDVKGFSNGALYADLDNDGDLELIVNTINDKAHVYENKSEQFTNRNFLKIILKGNIKNRNGIGTKIQLRYTKGQQFYEHFLSRGYESSVDQVIHFGLGNIGVVDSVEVIWPDGKYQLLRKVAANQLLQVDYAQATAKPMLTQASPAPLFTEITDRSGLIYQHEENEYVDFKKQPLLPHMHSRLGPGISVADVNADGLEDVYLAGASNHRGALFVQQTNGQFQRVATPAMDSLSEQMGVLLFDCDKDGDEDLYVGSGGSEHPKGSPLYQDKLYLNDGKGGFSLAQGALPSLKESTSCVIAADYDKDGDLDLFVGARVIPGEYPMLPTSTLLRNEISQGECRFTDVTQELAPSLQKAGMVSAALWTDYDRDGWIDLVVTGEFMPIRFFHNQKGSFTEATSTGITDKRGWWNSLAAADFDGDGDMDYVAGNLGLNTKYRATDKEPLCVHAADYNKDGRMDPIMSYYLQGEKQLIHSRDDLIDQISAMKGRFRSYKAYAQATFEESFLPQELEQAYVACSNWMQSSYIENLGKGKFAIKPLPIEAQVAPIFGMLTADYTGDGHIDVLAVGNAYSTEVATGRYDALQGLLLKGDGKGGFLAASSKESGFLADKDAKGIARLITADGRELVLVGNNADKLQVYETKQRGGYYKAQRADAYAEVTLKNGKTCRQEFSYGSSYLSHASRTVRLTPDIVRIKVVDFQGVSRILENRVELVNQ